MHGMKRKVGQDGAGGRQTTNKKARGIRGMLKDVKEMPLDILFEIFSLLNPIDLVNLSRTGKDLRAMLTSRSSISVWKAARDNIVPYMPDCPDDLSEPQYAELVFGKGCHYCQRNLGKIYTVWEARRRICNKCVDIHCSPYFPGNEMRTIDILNQYLPEIEVFRKFSGRSTSPMTLYFVEFSDLWLETYDNITDVKEKESWRRSKVEERKAINDHTRLCIDWEEEYSEEQQFLLSQVIRKRKDDISKHVADLGWGDEVLKMLPYEKKFEDQVEVRKICRKELTNRILLNLDAKINEYMETVKQARLKRERLTSLQDRLPILQKVHDDQCLTFPTACYPTASELFLHEPKIQDIINDTSSTLEVMKEQLVVTLPKIYPDSITQITRRIDDQLLEVIAVCRPEEVIDRDTIFGLATTVFECSQCDYPARILRYKDALLHSCTRKSNFPEESEDQASILKFLKGNYRSHKNGLNGSLTMSKTALKLVPILLRLCGFDPCTTTIQMMDDLEPIFECIPCGNSAVGRATMTWLGAVVHFNRKRHDFKIEEGMKLERLNEDEEDVVRKRIIEAQERAVASTSGWENPLVQCAHCSLNGNSCSKTMLLKHVKESHEIENPTDNDLMLNVDANHIPDTFFMWPPCKGTPRVNMPQFTREFT